MVQKRIHLSLIIFLLLIFQMNGFAEDQDVTIHGFLSQGYLKSDHNNFYANTEDGSFQFNEMGINFATSLSPALHLGMQLFARDLGTIDNDKLTVSWAYGDFRFRDYLGFRAGIMKLPYGLYNEIRDMDILRPNILYPNGVYNESWRDFLSSIKGVGVYGNFGIGILGKFKYNSQAGVVDIGLDSSASKLVQNQATIISPDATTEMKDIQVRHAYCGQAFLYAPFSIRGLKVGCSYLDLKYDNTIGLTSSLYSDDVSLSIHSDMLVSSLEYSWRNFTLASEYAKINLNFNLPAGISAFVPDKYKKYSTNAYYFSLSCDVTSWLETYVCYSEYNSNDNDKDGKMFDRTDQHFLRWLDEIIISLRFDINESWNCKLETHFIDGATTLIDKDQDEPEVLSGGILKYPYKRHWILCAAKVSYNF